ncbi:hypothetical protein ACFQY4_26030 [Catellatospora bangladeshensis]
MEDFAAPCDAALDMFLRWARGNMLADDEIAVLDFAGSSGARLRPTAIASLPRRLPGAVAVDGSSTEFGPVLHSVAQMPATTSEVYLVLLSDGQLRGLPDDTDAADRMRAAHGLAGIRLLVPGADIEVPGGWTAAFPEAEPDRFDGNDANATGLTFARVLASCTGQFLA